MTSTIVPQDPLPISCEAEFERDMRFRVIRETNEFRKSTVVSFLLEQYDLLKSLHDSMQVAQSEDLTFHEARETVLKAAMEKILLGLPAVRHV